MAIPGLNIISYIRINNYNREIPLISLTMMLITFIYLIKLDIKLNKGLILVVYWFMFFERIYAFYYFLIFSN